MSSNYPLRPFLLETSATGKEIGRKEGEFFTASTISALLTIEKVKRKKKPLIPPEKEGGRNDYSLLPDAGYSYLRRGSAKV